MSKPNKKIYLLIDTNIFIQSCLLEKDIDDNKSIDALLKILDDNKASLLLPEIIKEEYYKNLNSKRLDKWETDFKNTFGTNKDQNEQNPDQRNKASKGQQSKSFEFSQQLITKFQKNIDEFKESQLKEFKETQKKIEKIFNHKKSQLIPFTRTHFFEAYKFFISGIKPVKTGDKAQAIQSDAVIMAGLYSFLKSKKNYELVICSNNDQDFSDNNIDNRKGLDEVIPVHPHIKSRIKGSVKLYKFLSVLLNKVFNIKIETNIKKAESTEINQRDTDNQLVGKSK